MHGLPHSSDVLVCRDPASGEVLAELPHFGPSNIDGVVGSAREAQGQWTGASFEQRAMVFGDVLATMVGSQSELVRLLAHDLGKSMQWGLLEELVPTAERLEFLSSSAAATGRSLVPHGVVALVMGHRTPLFDALAIGSTALSAGNALILKPDPRSTWCTLEFARVLRDALTSRGHSSALVEVVTGDEETERLLRGADIDVVGSTQPEHTSPRARSWIVITDQGPPSFDRIKALLAPLGGPRPVTFVASAEVIDEWDDALRQVLPKLSSEFPAEEGSEVGVAAEHDANDGARAIRGAVGRGGVHLPVGPANASLLRIDDPLDAITGQRLDVPMAMLAPFRDMQALGTAIRGLPRPVAAVVLMETEDEGRAFGLRHSVEDLYLSPWGPWARPVHGPPTSDHHVDLRRMGSSQAVISSPLRDLVSSGQGLGVLESLVRTRFAGGPLPRVQAAASLLRSWWSNRK